MFVKAVILVLRRRSGRQSARLVGFAKPRCRTYGKGSICVKCLLAGPPDGIALPFDLDLCFEAETLPSGSLGQWELRLAHFAGQRIARIQEPGGKSLIVL